MKYTKELLEHLVKESKCFAEVARKLGKRDNGGSIQHITNRIKQFNIDTSHFIGRKEHLNNIRFKHKKKHWTEVLVNNRFGDRRESHDLLRRALIESGEDYKCKECGLKEWNGKPISLHSDHINGDSLDNRKENLRFLCPNCHSQTKNYCRAKSSLEKSESINPLNKTREKYNIVKKNKYEQCPSCDEMKWVKSKYCKSCTGILNSPRKAERPTPEQLKEDINNMPMVKVGIKYGVSDNAVRKWIKFYKKHNQWKE